MFTEHTLYSQEGRHDGGRRPLFEKTKITMLDSCTRTEERKRDERRGLQRRFSRFKNETPAGRKSGCPPRSPRSSHAAHGTNKHTVSEQPERRERKTGESTILCETGTECFANCSATWFHARLEYDTIDARFPNRQRCDNVDSLNYAISNRSTMVRSRSTVIPQRAVTNTRSTVSYVDTLTHSTETWPSLTVFTAHDYFPFTTATHCLQRGASPPPVQRPSFRGDAATRQRGSARLSPLGGGARDAALAARLPVGIVLVHVELLWRRRAGRLGHERHGLVVHG